MDCAVHLTKARVPLVLREIKPITMITKLWHLLQEGTHGFGLHTKTLIGKGTRNRGCKRIRNDMANKC